jgi:hypothetical protein
MYILFCFLLLGQWYQNIHRVIHGNNPTLTSYWKIFCFIYFCSWVVLLWNCTLVYFLTSLISTEYFS